MKTFVKEYNFELKSDDRITLTTVMSKGNDLKDLISNAELYFEDWHGNEWEGLSLDGLHESEYKLIEEDMINFLVGE